MDHKRKIGIIFGESESWAGGFYYVLNLIKALTYLPAASRPELIVFYEDSNIIPKINQLGYGEIIFKPIHPNKIQTKIKQIINRFKLNRLYSPGMYSSNEVEIAFPNNYYCHFQNLSKLHRAYWIPDFQHKHYPGNFAPHELEFREQRIVYIIDNNFPIMLSSKDAESDLKKFYKIKSSKVYVIPFCSLLSDFKAMDINSIKKEYKIDGQYLISPNQFWKHKNHIVVLKAVKILKDRGVNVLIIFTGNESGNPEYVNGLKQYLQQNDLQENIKFLGFLHRNVQLTLLQQAHGVLQPSLFEGWSTVIEDAKALGKFVIASSINVHKEQLPIGGVFFDPHDELELANLIHTSWNKPQQTVHLDYVKNILKFAEAIASIE